MKHYGSIVRLAAIYLVFLLLIYVIVVLLVRQFEIANAPALFVW